MHITSLLSSLGPTAKPCLFVTAFWSMQYRQKRWTPLSRLLVYILKDKRQVSYSDEIFFFFFPGNSKWQRENSALSNSALCCLWTYKYLFLWARFAQYKILSGVEKKYVTRTLRTWWFGESEAVDSTYFCFHNHAEHYKKGNLILKKCSFDSVYTNIMPHNFLTGSCNFDFCY